MSEWAKKPINRLASRGVTTTKQPDSRETSAQNLQVSRQYLQKLAKRLRDPQLIRQYSSSDKCKPKKCPFCQKSKSGLLAHVQAVHPEYLNEFKSYLNHSPLLSENKES